MNAGQSTNVSALRNHPRRLAAWSSSSTMLVALVSILCLLIPTMIEAEATASNGNIVPNAATLHATTQRYHRLLLLLQQQLSSPSAAAVVESPPHPSIRRMNFLSHSSSSNAAHEKSSTSNVDNYGNNNIQQQQSSSSSSPLFALSSEQYTHCTSTMIYSDTNSDYQLDKSEYLSFLSYSASNYYGYDGLGYDLSGEVSSMDDLPLELVMLFQSTACLCAYGDTPINKNSVKDKATDDDDDDHVIENDDQSNNSVTNNDSSIGSSVVGCCMGDLAHIQIYDSMGLFGAEKVTVEQAAYTSLFCTEAYYYLDSILGGVDDETGAPSYAPTTLAPSTEKPTSESPTSSMAPSSAMPTSLAPTATTISTDAPSATVAATYEPTEMESEITTNEPTSKDVGTATNEPTLVSTTYEPTAESVSTNEPTPVLTVEPTPVPTVEPTPVLTVEPTPTMTTLSPTTSKEIGTAPPVSPPVIPTPTVIELKIQYGLTSDCGVTAEDILTGKDGITIQDGLIVATEALLIEILNSTYPSSGVPAPAPDEGGMVITTESPTFAFTGGGMASTTSPTADATEGVVTFSPTVAATEGTTTAIPTTVPGDVGGTQSPSAVATGGTTTTIPTVPGSTTGTVGGSTPSPSATSSKDTATSTTSAPTAVASLETRNASIHAKFVGARVRINNLASEPLSRRALLSMLQDESPSLFRLHNNRLRRQHQRHHQQQHQQERRSRSMVYYTPENPVVINDITDITDETCPSELTCMKVDSTLYLTVEEGKDAEEVAIQSVVQSGFEASFQDFSFFNVSSILLLLCMLMI